MKAEIITYETKDMTNSKRSLLSKKLFGFKDRTKGSRYTYDRKGLIENVPHLVLTKKTFVVATKNADKIKKTIKKLGASVRSWKVEVSKGEMRKRYG